MPSMKRLFVLLGLTLVSSASADNIGLQFGHQTLLSENAKGRFSVGGQYVRSIGAFSDVRATVYMLPGKKILNETINTYGADVAYLRKIPTGLGANTGMSFYVGGGLGIEHVSFSVISATFINPTVLGGVNYALTPQLGLYAELAGGMKFGTAKLDVGKLGSLEGELKSNGFIHPRFGLTYTLR